MARRAWTQELAARSGPELPDSPGALLFQQTSAPASPKATAAQDSGAAPVTVCPPGQQTSAISAGQLPAATPAPCHTESPIRPFVTHATQPLTWQQKGRLAFRDTIDPFNLVTIGLSSGFDIGINAHSAFGPGFKGWGKLSGYTFVEDAQGEFSGTFAICSLAHEDPRYHRLPHGTVKRRVLHALTHTWVSQHDDGRPMPNYATLLTYPISAELSNLYVPGVPTNLPSTARRVGIGLATDPSGTLVSEFLPDLAKRIHVNVIFIQNILNQVITGGTAPNVQ